MRNICMLVIISLFIFSFAFAEEVSDDVYIESGVCDEDSGCTEPHYGSRQDGVRWNDYGPTESYRDRFVPGKRDFDDDGEPNVWDYDDDDDLIPDDYDFNQYGENIVYDDFTYQP
jgi:hypothetical protein